MSNGREMDGLQTIGLIVLLLVVAGVIGLSRYLVSDDMYPRVAAAERAEICAHWIRSDSHVEINGVKYLLYCRPDVCVTVISCEE